MTAYVRLGLMRCCCPCKSVLAFFLHDLVGPGEEDGGAEEGHVDKDLPLDVFEIFILDIDERFQKMNAGDADQGGASLILMVPGSMCVSHSGRSGWPSKSNLLTKVA